MSFVTIFEERTTWPTSLSQLSIVVFPLALALYLLASVIYNLYFHSLRNFPGPKLASASKIPNVWSIVSGGRASYLRNLHDTYGSVMRTAPNEISFTDSAAWKTLCTHRPFQKNFHLYYNRVPGRPHNILVSDDADHSRQRRILAKAFSDTALKEQEPVVQTYVDTFIQKLHEQTKNTKDSVVDIVQLYSWLTFDIVGDLTIGQSFHALHGHDAPYGEVSHRDWSESLYDGLKAWVFANAMKNFPPLDRILRSLIPKWLIEKQLKQYKVATDMIDDRIAMDTDRSDFMTHILRHNIKAQISREEMHSNASFFVTAGHDTSASLLSGMTYLLLRSPKVLQKLTTEIREAFQNENEIGFESVSRLQYLSAAIQESFRLYPPVPEGVARVAPPEGANICGHWVRGGTFVQISPFAANRSAANFAQPDTFIPERWVDPAFNSDDKRVLQPYSMGTRNCIGFKLANAIIRLTMVKLLWSFDMELSEPDKDWMKQRSWIMWDKGPMNVTLRPVSGRQ